MNSGLPGASVHEQLRRRAGGSRNVHLVAAIRSSRPPGGPPYYAGMEPIVLRPGGGRTYEMGRITATFKVDVPRCTISEWWLEPDTAGPGPHSHPDDDVFYVLAGTMRICVDGVWHDAGAGAYVHVPGGVTHDFENRGTERAGMLNVSVPGGFEQNMPSIADWFRARDGD